MRDAARAQLPDGVEPGAFGPRLRATVVMLAAILLSRRATLTLPRDMFAAKISLGSIDNILKQGRRRAPWEAIKAAVQAADVAHADETNWRKAGQRLWLWAALSATACCFRIDPTRARTAAKTLLGSLDGASLEIKHTSTRVRLKSNPTRNISDPHSPFFSNTSRNNPTHRVR